MEDYYWLNKYSRQFLERDYLKEGQTPEERIKEIAQNAQKILLEMSNNNSYFLNFAEKFETYMRKGFYSNATPVWTNFGNERGLPVSCVAEDAWINTRYGGKQAKDIVIGDEVLTHKNRYRKVIDIIPTKDKDDIYILKVSSRMTPIKITGNHLVKTNIGWTRVDELDKDKHLIAVNGQLSIDNKADIEIDLTPFSYGTYEVDENDGLLKKTITKKNQKKTGRKYSAYHSTPSAKIKYDNDLAWALGLWFAEGSLSTRKGEPSGIRITLCADEQHLAERFYQIISEKFNLFGSIHKTEIIRNNKKNSWINVNINSNIIGNFFDSFGRGCKNKKIPNWIMDSSIELKEHFLSGILTGDGTLTKSEGNRITLANPLLILQIYRIGLELNKEMSLQMQEKAAKLATTSHVYTVLFRNYKNSRNKHNANAGIKFEDGLIYCPIKHLEKTNLRKNVYDFTVEEDHSFSVSGVVVHNCFNSHISDTMWSILDKVGEVGIMSKLGGGTSGYFGHLRPRGASISDGGSSSGPVHFMELFDKVSSVVSQGATRRGAFAAYLPIEHPDVEEFLQLRAEGHPIQEMSFGITVTDKWLQEMENGDKNKRKIWGKVIQKRFETGYPYVIFIDNANNNSPQVYKDNDLEIKASNLCSEIFLSSDEKNSFVCVLSSLNLLHWDEIKETDALETMIYFLDAVNEEFVRKTENMRFMETAHNFAKTQRALGMGVLGWHSYLQSNMIPFESMEAKMKNAEIWRTIRVKSDTASEKLAKLCGEPELLKGYGRRNVTTLAVAPTTSSAFILGQVSPSIEPENSNYYTKKLAKGSFTYKNPYLKKLLKEKDQNTDEVWDSILLHGGSVQHLDFLTEDERSVFRTFGEMSQKEIIIQAAQRQKYIDQGQSLNLMIPPDAKPKEVNQLMFEAWKLGVKGLYYQRSASPAQQLSRNLTACISCES